MQFNTLNNYNDGYVENNFKYKKQDSIKHFLDLDDDDLFEIDFAATVYIPTHRNNDSDSDDLDVNSTIQSIKKDTSIKTKEIKFIQRDVPILKEMFETDPFCIDEKLNLETTVHLKKTNNNDNKNIKSEKIIEFKQKDIINAGKLPEGLNKINLKFNGLCDLICNKILIDDLLGKDDENSLKEKININELNKESILKSHLLHVYSFFDRLISFIFNIYPDNIFSINDQWKLVNNNKVNEGILFEGLKDIESGTTLKVEVFKKTKDSFSGHSLLIKKIKNDEFIFFDPNEGETRELSQKDLVEKINNQLVENQGTDIFISKGDSYIKRLKNKNIIDKAKSIFKTK